MKCISLRRVLMLPEDIVISWYILIGLYLGFLGICSIYERKPSVEAGVLLFVIGVIIVSIITIAIILRKPFIFRLFLSAIGIGAIVFISFNRPIEPFMSSIIKIFVVCTIIEIAYFFFDRKKTKVSVCSETDSR